MKTATLLLGLLLGTGSVGQQTPLEQLAASRAQLKAAIDNLGKFDVAVRTAAARTARRAPPAQAVPALIEAATGHAKSKGKRPWIKHYV